MEQTEKTGNCTNMYSTGRESWLPLFYCLPQELVYKRDELQRIPRCPYTVFHSDKYDSLIDSEEFRHDLLCEYEKAIWRFIKVPGSAGTYRSIPESISCYSRNFAIRQLAMNACTHMRDMLENTDHSRQALRKLPDGFQVPWMTLADFYEMVSNLTAQIIQEQHWQQIIDFAWKELTLEDFSKRRSNRKINAYHAWNHTRTKTGEKMISYDALMEKADEKGYSIGIPVSHADPAVLTEYRNNAAYDSDEYCGWYTDGPYREWQERKIRLLRKRYRIEVDMLCSAFGYRLCDEDRQLLVLRIEGYTCKEMATLQGFSSHSGVVNRLKHIEEQYEAKASLKPRRNKLVSKVLSSWTIRPFYGIHINGRRCDSISTLKGCTYCQSCRKKENTGKRDAQCDIYKRGSICAAADLNCVHSLRCKRRMKRSRTTKILCELP